MELEGAIRYALDGKAILFAGSGFSYGAKNFDDHSFRVGNSLRDLLATECGIASTSNSLSTIAQFFKKRKSPEEMIQLLKKEFAVKSIAPWHEILLSAKWKRIYTTNYDSVIETAAKSNGRYLQPVVPSEKTEIYDPSNVCVHLNGFIENLNIRTLDNEFKLTDMSYDSDALEGKPWFEFMKSDLKSAQAIIIIGYSMQFDIDIKRLLSPPGISQKIIFVNKPGLDEVEESLLKDYGNCELIGIDGFAAVLGETLKTFKPSVGEPPYICFLHEQMTPLLSEVVSYDDISLFYNRGVFKDRLLTKSQIAGYDDKYKYLVLRNGVNITVNQIAQKKVFLATSDLGNGKTIYCQLVRNELRTKDINIFCFSKRLEGLDAEIESICRIRDKRSVVIIDNYQSKIDILNRFGEFGISKITFILTARRSINAPNYRKLITALRIEPSDVHPIFLDGLVEDEVTQLSNILSNESVFSKVMDATSTEAIEDYIIQHCHSRFSDLLLVLFQSSDIKKRIFDVYNETDQKRPDLKKVAIFALMKSVMNIEVDFTDIITLMKLDYITLSDRENEFLNEFFNVSDNDVAVKSSVVARELLYTVISLSDVINTIYSIIVEADKAFRTNGSYKDMLRNLVSHTHFVPFIAQGCNVDEIKDFYNSIRYTHFCAVQNPFYWEQFASACIDAKDYPLANQCLETAFAVAKTIPRFVPFQIETIKARCIIESLLSTYEEHLGDPEMVIQRLVECHDRLMKYFDHPDNNVYYIFKVGIKYVDIYNRSKDMFSARQKSIFTEKRVDMVQKMRRYAGQYNNISKWIEQLNSCVF